MEKQARILGLDYGARRIGVAISDPLGITAQPLFSVRNKKVTVVGELVQLIREKEVQEVVLGLPRHMSGEESAAAGEVRVLGEALGLQTSVQVHYMDERLTTVAAQRVLTESGMSGPKQRQAIDKIAAAIILQTWMDFQKNTKQRSSQNE